MPGFANRYTIMPGQSRALVCPDRGVTPGIRALCPVSGGAGWLCRLPTKPPGPTQATIRDLSYCTCLFMGSSCIATTRTVWLPEIGEVIDTAALQFQA